MQIPGVQARRNIEVIETVQVFEAQIFANPESVILAAVIPSQARMIQLPFGRLEFVAFLAEMNKAMERVPSLEAVADVPNGNEAA